MPSIFSCFGSAPAQQGAKLAAAPVGTSAVCLQPAPRGVPGTPKEEARGVPAAAERPGGNAGVLRLLNALSALEELGADGWCSALNCACEALCCHLDADQSCIYLLSKDDSATLLTSAGIDTAHGGRHARAEARVSPTSVACSVPYTLVWALESCPSSLVVYREAAAPPACTPSTPCDAASPAAAAGSAAGSATQRAAGELPAEWRQLWCEAACRHFAAVAVMASGEPLAVFSLAARGPTRPSSWSSEVLHAVSALLTAHVKRAQVLADALPSLHAAATISHVVQALGAAAVEAAAGVAHVRGHVRVAFIQPNAGAAAVFPHAQPSSGSAAPKPFSRQLSRRASCEFLMAPNSPVQPLLSGARATNEFRAACARASMDMGMVPSAASYAQGLGDVSSAAGLANGPFFPLLGSRPNSSVRQRLSFTLPSDKDATCKGHTLPLASTLLAEALSKGAAGLCIDDCASYVQDTKAYPRDLVLSRDAVMPQSLVLATLMTKDRVGRSHQNNNSSNSYHYGRGSSSSATNATPLVAVYATFAQPLPQSLLQVAARELRELLQAVAPIILAKTLGTLQCEWDHLLTLLAEALRRKGGELRGPSNQQLVQPADDTGTSPAAVGSAVAAAAAAAAGASAGVDRVGQEAAPANPGIAEQQQGAAEGRGMAEELSPFTTHSQHGSAAAMQHHVPARPSPLGSLQQSDGPGPKRVHSALSRWLGLGPRAGEALGGGGRAMSSPDHNDVEVSSGDGLGKHRLSQNSQGEQKAVAVRRHLGVLATRSVSFRLEAAQSPRGASKLAPIIALMHERLKAAQASQITNSQSSNRQLELESLKLLQEIGKGGYGTVYRATYHGAEVAVKVIQDLQLATPALLQSGGDSMGKWSAKQSPPQSSVVELHKQNLHDAIELVASVSMSHPNIVQVLTFFTDCKLQEETVDDPAMFESGNLKHPPADAPVRLVHMPAALLESPLPGQDTTGASSMALVMEYCDAGSLCDAIMHRVFCKQLQGTDAGARPGKPLWAISMRYVYSTLLEVALALRHMHGLHLVHCDLKPQNVLLKSSPRDPRGFTAKLSDFGLSKMMAHDEEGQLVIDEAVASGTITHVAPEIFLGKRPVGAAVDIYAFGVLMYQCVCGVRLYEGLTAQQVANAVAHDGLRPVMPTWVPSGYRALAERCWHAVPSVRPTADELVRQLEKLGTVRPAQQHGHRAVSAVQLRG